jgi:chaperonin GroES
MKKLLDLLKTSDETKLVNVAEKLEKDKLYEIGRDVCRYFKEDKESRSQWEKQMECALKFAKQIMEPKNFPFPGASNVIIPILTIASNVFASRVYPEIFSSPKIVKALHLGEDADGSGYRRAERISSHMSYQLLVESDTWEPDMDKLLHILPVVGTCFKKVYYDPIKNKPCSELCNPKDIVIHNSTASLATAKRITHRIVCDKNFIVSRIRSGYYIDIENLEPISMIEDRITVDKDDSNVFTPNNFEQYELLEQHTTLDLDDDGYEEAYIVVVNRQSAEVLGIFPRFTLDDIKLNQKNKIICIEPIQSFIDFHFLPSPDGGFWSSGYGHVLYPLNKAANTLTNQLIDSGTYSNTQGGFIGRQVKIKGGAVKFSMGEFTEVDVGTTGAIQDHIMPFPFKEPSQTSLALLELLMSFCKEIASINDVLTGDALPQNAPAGSVSQLQSNSLKPFTSINKRFWRSEKKEFQLLFDLNKKYLDPKQYLAYHKTQECVSPFDYEADALDVMPTADPNLSSEVQKTSQIQMTTNLLNIPAAAQVLNVRETLIEFYRAIKTPEEEIKRLVPEPDPNAPPPIEQQELQLKAQIAEQKAQMDQMTKETEHLKQQAEIMKLELKNKESQDKAIQRQQDALQKHVETSYLDDQNQQKNR